MNGCAAAAPLSNSLFRSTGYRDIPFAELSGYGASASVVLERPFTSTGSLKTIPSARGLGAWRRPALLLFGTDMDAIAAGPLVNERRGGAGLQRETLIRAVECWITDAPTRRRHVQSNTELTRQSYVHVRVQLENGAVGWGEASTLGGPRWAEESVEAIKANIDSYLAPVLIGRAGCLFEANSQLLDRAALRNNSAKAALDMAQYDAVGRTLGISAAQLLGGSVQTQFSTIWGLASGDVDQEIEEAREKIAARLFNRFKIKLGFFPATVEIARLRAIRDALGPDIELIVDINQAWLEATCKRFLPPLEELNVSLIEQPLPRGQISGLGRIAAQTRIPIMLDESCFSAVDTLNCLRAGAGSVLSLKLVKSGGMLEARRMAAIAEAHGAELYGGCLLESSLGAAAHLQVFSTLASLHWGTEHFGPRILVEDLVSTPLVYENFTVRVPEGPGLGVEPDLDLLKQYRRAS
jgi:muconate cycloisomerase